MATKNKAQRLSGINPLAYLGVEPSTPSLFVTNDRAPTPRDTDGFDLGAIWLDTDTEIPYMLTNLDAGVATWTMLSPGGTGANTFNTNIDSPVHDLAGVVGVVGNSNILTNGTTPNVVTIDLIPHPIVGS